MLLFFYRFFPFLSTTDIVVVDKMQKTVGLIDVTTTSGRRSMRK